MKKTTHFLMYAVVLLFSTVLMAQSTVSGTILEKGSNIPLPGANVIEKGTSNGVTTDFDGNFSLKTLSSSGEIVISYIGYNSATISFSGDSALGNVGVVKSLLKLGADVNSVTQNGSTALLQALWTLHSTRVDNWEHNDEVNGVPVRCTLEKGYLTYYYNYDKYHPRPGRLMTLKEQRNIARQTWAPFEHLDYLNALEVIKELVKGGVSVTQADDRGISPLRVACSAGVGSVLELLYKKGANFEEKAWNQVTLLHQTAGSGRIDGLKTFFKLAKEPTINAQDANGWTPAHYLADTGGPLEMAGLLLKHGADPSIESTQATEYFPKGTTAAKIALHWKDMDLAMELA